MRAFSVLHGFWLSANDVELGVGDHEDMAHHVARAFGATFDFQLDAVCGVHKARAAAMHFTVCHRAQINQNPKLIASVELLQIHVFSFIIFFHKEAAGLFSRPCFRCHRCRACWANRFDGNADFCHAREDVFFRVSGARGIQLYEKKEDAFHGPSLGVDFYVQPRVCVFFEGHHFMADHVISELLVARVHAARLFDLRVSGCGSFRTLAGCWSACVLAWLGLPL